LKLAFALASRFRKGFCEFAQLGACPGIPLQLPVADSRVLESELLPKALPD